MNQNNSTTRGQVAQCDPKGLSALELASSGGVHWNGNGEFFVASTQQAGVFFQVSKAAEVHKWTCTCKAFRERGGLCVHILAAYKVADKAKLQAGAR